MKRPADQAPLMPPKPPLQSEPTARLVRRRLERQAGSPPPADASAMRPQQENVGMGDPPTPPAEAWTIDPQARTILESLQRELDENPRATTEQKKAGPTVREFLNLSQKNGLISKRSAYPLDPYLTRLNAGRPAGAPPTTVADMVASFPELVRHRTEAVHAASSAAEKMNLRHAFTGLITACYPDTPARSLATRLTDTTLTWTAALHIDCLLCEQGLVLADVSKLPNGSDAENRARTRHFIQIKREAAPVMPSSQNKHAFRLLRRHLHQLPQDVDLEARITAARYGNGGSRLPEGSINTFKEIDCELSEELWLHNVSVQTFLDGVHSFQDAGKLMGFMDAPQPFGEDAPSLNFQALSAATYGKSALTNFLNFFIEHDQQAITDAAEARRLKQEREACAVGFAAPREGPPESEWINTLQQQTMPTTVYPMMDLTGAAKVDTVHVVRRPEEPMLVTGKQVYDPQLDERFPIRDPGNPVHVHPAYADPQNPRRVAQQVNATGVKFYKSGRNVNEVVLWRTAKKWFPQMKFDSKNTMMNALRESALVEIRATIANRAPPSCGAMRVVPIDREEQCDSAAEFAALKGQLGCVPADYAPDRQASLGNGRILCLFAGSKLASDEDDEAYYKSFGKEYTRLAADGLRDYAAKARERGRNNAVVWAPYGGGNMAQYINSSFKPDENGTVTCNEDKTNTFLCPVTFDLTDAHGGKREETMLALIQFRPVKEPKQNKLNYGPGYTMDGAGAPPGSPKVAVKIEPED